MKAKRKDGVSVRAEIERQWRLFGSVIPAMQLAETKASLPVVPGRDRTRYFYRKQALVWARRSRLPEWVAGSRATAIDFAKMYLKSYRLLCAIAEGKL